MDKVILIILLVLVGYSTWSLCKTIIKSDRKLKYIEISDLELHNSNNEIIK